MNRYAYMVAKLDRDIFNLRKLKISIISSALGGDTFINLFTHQRKTGGRVWVSSENSFIIKFSDGSKYRHEFNFDTNDTDFWGTWGKV